MSNNVLAYDSSDPKVKIEDKNRKEKVSHEIKIESWEKFITLLPLYPPRIPDLVIIHCGGYLEIAKMIQRP